MKSRLLLTSLAVPGALFLLVMLTLLFIPEKEIEGLFSRALGNQGYTFKSNNLRLTVPFGIKATRVAIGSNKGTLVTLDTLSVKLRILPLFAGKVVVGYQGTIGPGVVRGEYGLSGKGQLKLDITGVRLEDIPFFAAVTGATVKGDLRAKGTITGKQAAATGDLQLTIKEAHLQGVKIGAMPLPDASYKTVQGMLQIGGGKATLHSLTFDGDGIYTRLKGDLPLIAPLSAAPLNFNLELMPRADFLDKQKFVFLLLIKYQLSPGHYQLPVRGTLGKPAVM